jgi:hypothetical protein
MQATGLKTTQPAYNKDFFGILLTGVVLAAVIAALIIVTSGKPAQALPTAGAAPAANVFDSPDRVRFLAEERGVSVAAPRPGAGRVLPVGDERNLNAMNPNALKPATGHVLPLGDERILSTADTDSAPKAHLHGRHTTGK